MFDAQIRIKAAMGNELYRERLTAAIQKSPHMQRAIQQSPAMQELQKQTENNPLLQPFQDEKVCMRPRLQSALALTVYD